MAARAVVIIVMGLGWWLPALGFIVPVTMLTGMVGGLIGGRWVCGNFCPRGSFFDRMLAPIVPNRTSPRWMRNLTFRWLVFAALMGFMVFRITLNPGEWRHWGRVFWLMCMITTTIGIVGAFAFSARFWCTFCPVGTFASVVGGHKRQPLLSDETCKDCGQCATACPMHLDVTAGRQSGHITDRDCIRCDECAPACPFGAIGKS